MTGSGNDGNSEFRFDIRSGPSGENPSGTATATVAGLGGQTFTGIETTSLSVSGNTATSVGRLARNSFGFTFAKIPVTDNGSTGDTCASAAYRTVSAPTCSTITNDPASVFPEASLYGPPTVILRGSIVVVDAHPLPASKDQCKHGAWRQYGVFKNQGDCVNFVATGGRNQPGNPPH